MKVMLGHFNVGVAYHTLNGLHIHAQGLELGDIGVAAAVGREQTDAGNPKQSVAVLVPKVAGVDRLTGGHRAFPS